MEIVIVAIPVGVTIVYYIIDNTVDEHKKHIIYSLVWAAMNIGLLVWSTYVCVVFVQLWNSGIPLPITIWAMLIVSAFVYTFMQIVSWVRLYCYYYKRSLSIRLPR